MIPVADEVDLAHLDQFHRRQRHLAWIPTLLGIGGAGLLFYASLLLIAESRVALAAVNDEMDFVLRLSR